MVIVQQALARLMCAVVLAADDADPVMQKLDPQQRGAVVLVFVGLVILLLGMIALVWMGAQHVRRVARQRPAPRPRELSNWNRSVLDKIQLPPRGNDEDENNRST